MLMPSIFGGNMFDEFFGDSSSDGRGMKKLEKKMYGRRGKNLMKIDIRETDTEYELEVNLPGSKKDEVKVSLKDEYLTICAAKGLDKDEREKNSGRYIRQGRYVDACERSFYVSGGVADEDIKGRLKHDILGLSIPKEDAKSLAEGKKYISIEG